MKVGPELRPTFLNYEILDGTYEVRDGMVLRLGYGRNYRKNEGRR